jgi:hypothetical protein
LVKYFYFLKEEFNDKINNNEIHKMTYNDYIFKMKNIRYNVIFDDIQHPLYIYDLDLNKIIDIQKCKILYQINYYFFIKPFITPTIYYYYYYYYYCKKLFNSNKYFNNERQKEDFLDLMKKIMLEFNDNYEQYFRDIYLFVKDDNGDDNDDVYNYDDDYNNK